MDKADIKRTITDLRLGLDQSPYPFLFKTNTVLERIRKFHSFDWNTMKTKVLISDYPEDTICVHNRHKNEIQVHFKSPLTNHHGWKRYSRFIMSMYWDHQWSNEPGTCYFSPCSLSEMHKEIPATCMNVLNHLTTLAFDVSK